MGWQQDISYSIRSAFILSKGLLASFSENLLYSFSCERRSRKTGSETITGEDRRLLPAEGLRVPVQELHDCACFMVHLVHHEGQC